MNFPPGMSNEDDSPSSLYERELIVLAIKLDRNDLSRYF